MSLILTITYHPPLLSVKETSKTLNEGTLTIGRAPNNDWVLPDPERILSGQHCLIEFRDGNYFITDTSTNGVFLNDADERLERGHTVQLTRGDYFTVGDYEITVEIGAGDADAIEDIEDKEQSTDITPAALDVFSGGPPSSSARSDVRLNDPFAASAAKATPLTKAEDICPEDSGLLGRDSPTPAPKYQPTESDHLAPEKEFIQPPETIPEEKESADTELSRETPTEKKSTEKTALTDNDLLIPDDWWQEEIKQPSNIEPRPEGEPDLPLEEKKPVPEPSLSETPSRAEVVSSPAEIHPERKFTISEQKPTSVVLDKATIPSPSTRDHRESEPTSAAPSRQAQKAIVQAFLKGANLEKLSLAEDRYEDIMENVGRIFRETIQGIMEILQARSSVKGEFRLERTTLGPIDNNPLKTPPGRTPLSVEETMALLLSEQPQGFIPPVQAVQESLEDIKAHQIAVMAGIQSALTLLLERFDPDVLEDRLSRDSMLDQLLPGKRKARYWDSFKTLYAQLAREAEDDFNEIFGKEFAKAYEKQIYNL